MPIAKTYGPLNTVADYLAFIAFWLLMWLFRLLPRRLALRLGALLGGLTRLSKREKRRVHDNLRQSFPEWSEAQLAPVARRVFAHLGMVAVEVLRLGGWNGARMRDLIEVEGLEHLREAEARGKGVLLMSAHIGFWEAIALFLPTLGFTHLAGVAKTLRNAFITRYMARQRLKHGGMLIDAHRGASRIVRALAEKRVLVILMDQRTSVNEGVLVPFFGRDASTTPIVAKIAAKQGVPVVPCYVCRNPDLTYRMVFEPALELEENGSEEALVANTAKMTASIEAAIRRDPGQWCWNYRRWDMKRRPPEEIAAQREHFGSANPFD